MSLRRDWFKKVNGMSETALTNLYKEAKMSKEVTVNSGLRLKAEIENQSGSKTKVAINSGMVEAYFDWKDAEEVIKLMEDMIVVRNTLSQSKFVENK